MPSGDTNSNALADSLPTIIASARLVNEYEGVYNRTCEMDRRATGTGLDWNEISVAKLTAQAVTETTILDNPQQIQDTLLTATPLMSGIMVRQTDRMRRTISPNVAALIGRTAGNAMTRYKDQQYLAIFATGSTTASPGTGQPFGFGFVSAAVSNIKGNATEPAMSDIYTVADPFHVKDVQDEILAGVGTYTIPTGMTEQIFRQGFSGSIADSNVFTDGNITRDATPDSSSATHSRNAVVMVTGMTPRTETRRRPDYGGGSDELFMYDEFVLVERSSGNWLYRHLADATAPTS